MSKEINARVLLKYDTAENWAKATFTPKRGEMLIYAPEGDTPVRYKIGDGETPIYDLPFVATAGEPGADGIGIASITQTTTSTEDDGNNIVTVALTNGATSTFVVQNGSKGGKGDPGAPGTAATVEIGSVTTGAAGSSASVTNSGTAQAAKLNFTIPKGEKGDPGDDGIASVTTTGSGNVITGLSYNESTKVLTATKGSPALPNPKALTVGSKTYDGSSEVSITASDLGLSAAMKFIGTSQVSIEDGDVTNPITIDGKTVTATNGNVAIYGAKEFIWNGSAWEEFGNEGDYKVKQQANSKTATTTQTIKSISQNENGDVTVETQDIAFPVTSVNGQKGAVTIGVPTALADLTADSTHRTVTDAEKSMWNAKSSFSGSYNDLTNKPTIPTKTSELTNDSGFKTTDNNTTYTFATGDSNGQIKVTPSSGNAQNVSVKGLGSAAYTASTNYAPSSHVGDSTHVSATEKAAWNAKSNFSGNYNDLTNKPTIPTIPSSLPANGGNADTVDGKHADDFMESNPISIELNESGGLSGYGGFIDFHFDGSSSDYTSRIIEEASGTLKINGVTVSGNTITGALNGVAKWATYDQSGNHITSTYATKAEAAKIATGSYTGTGTYGGSNRTGIWGLSFEPKAILISAWERWAVTQFAVAIQGTQAVQTSLISNESMAYFTWESNSVNWWNGESALKQLNESGTTYHYVIIG